jgi:CRP/FNR family cyclic AMP-dependent transcriptional regulator
MSKSVTTVLSLSEFFDDLTDAQLEMIAAICETVSYDQGDMLIHEDAHTNELYIIGEGAVEILMTHPEVEEPAVVAELLPGQAFGEVALVDQGARSATARVSEEGTYVVRIPGDRLMALCDEHPEMGYQVMKNLAADLALKIRIANLTIRQYQWMLSKTEG